MKSYFFYQARQLQLIKELLLDKDSGSMLSLADKQALAQSIHQCSSISHMPKDEAKSDLPNQRLAYAIFIEPNTFCGRQCDFSLQIKP